MKIRYLLLGFSLIISQFTMAQPDWQKINTVEEVCAAYPEQMKSIFQNLNLDYPGLEKAKKAFDANQLPEACKLLLAYYGKSDRVQHQLPAVTTKSTAGADSILHDIFTFQLVPGQVPRLPDGRLKWDCKGPENDMEWAWALNRHYPTQSLLADWEKNGNPEYLKYIDQFTKDWIISSWPYPAKKSSTAMWRGLEVSFRAKMWAKIFYELWDTQLISPATKLLILSSLPEHADYARNYHAQGNWLTMEISGLATVASYWPEYKKSPEWMKYSIETMGASMKEQVYPDGVQTELTSHYHHVALANFSLFAELCRKSKVPLPEYFTKTLEDMTGYLAKTMRPDGFGLLNNDADLDDNREFLRKAAQKYNRPDWEFIATNGKSGTKPTDGPSYIFPWAGQLISRSDFGADAQWSFFDIGPWGTGHQHNDKLHLSVAAFGRDLLVDGGRFAYQGEVARKFRKYATGSASHNVVLVDGKGQAAGVARAETPLSNDLFAITPEYDYGSGSFDKFSGVEGNFSHTRSVVYVRGKFWVVADQLKTDRPRSIETLWHWNPSCKVETGNSGTVRTINDRGNLEIIPVGNPDWKVAQVKGQETPTIQGWYSKEYNTYEPNPTTIYSRELKTNDSFVWILWPSEGKAPEIKTEIMAKTADSVKIRVTEAGKGSWVILVPFLNSKAVKVEFRSGD